MTYSEVSNQSDNTFQDAPSKESIREWRSSMESFFSEDWQQVGQIITRLEDSLWENTSQGKAEPKHASRSQGESNCEAQLDAMRKTPVPVSNDPQQKQRLEELAQKIENRLKNNSRESSV